MARKKGLLAIFKKTFRDFSDDDCPSMAGSLAYYTIFALPPLLLVIISIAGLVFGQEAAQGQIVQQFQGLVGQDGAQEVQTMIQGAAKSGSGSIIATIIGLIMLIFGATGAFIQLQVALNKAWEVKPDPEQGGIKVFITKRLLSLGMILGIAFLLLVSLAMSAALAAFGGMLQNMLPEGFSEPLLHAINLSIAFVIVALLFGAMFKVLPDAKIAWKDVWVGAIFTTVLFLIGKLLIGLYLGKSDMGSTYGAAGSLVIVLLWIYYASMIFLFGAEFTQAWANTRGSKIHPTEGAVRVVETEHEQRSTGETKPSGDVSREERERAAFEAARARAVEQRSTGETKPSGDVSREERERAAFEAARARAVEQQPAIKTAIFRPDMQAKKQHPVGTALVGASVGAFLVWLFRDKNRK